MKTLFRTSVVAAAMLLWATSATAQQAPPPEKPEERVAVFGVGGVLIQQVIRDGQLSTTGPTLGFQYRSAHKSAAAFVVEISIQASPAKDRHPLIADSLAPFYLMGGAEFGRGRYVRLSAGFTSVATVAPIAGIAIGFESRGKGPITGIEFVARVAGTAKSHGVLAGVQARIGGHAGAQ